MTQRVSVVSPRIVRPPNYGARALLALLLLVVFGAAVGGAFYAGVRVEREATKALVESVRAKEQEREALSKEVLELKQQSIVLGRSLQIDREANRTVSQQLKGAQDERLAAEKEVSFLRRLIQEGGGGILQPKDFELKEADEQGEFLYSFTIQQLIQDFGESSGTIDIEVLGKREGQEAALALGNMAGSEPTSHELKLKHFQVIEGRIRIPEGFEPENLVVEINPRTAKLIPVSETFPWSPEQ